MHRSIYATASDWHMQDDRWDTTSLGMSSGIASTVIHTHAKQSRYPPRSLTGHFLLGRPREGPGRDEKHAVSTWHAESQVWRLSYAVQCNLWMISLGCRRPPPSELISLDIRSRNKSTGCVEPGTALATFAVINSCARLFLLERGPPPSCFIAYQSCFGSKLAGA